MSIDLRTPLRVGSMFAGIGGIDLGLERTGGFKTAWFAEIDEYASAAEWQIVSAASVGAPHLRERFVIVAYANGERSQGWGLPSSKSEEFFGGTVSP